MADFRKLFIVLAVLALAATSAFGQPFSCNATTVTQTMRGGGITELAGDINLGCTGGVAGSTITSFTVQIQGGASAITNTIGGVTITGYPMIGAALTVLDVSLAPIASYTGYLQTNAPTVAVFPAVTVPTGTTTYIKISGLRVAAQQVTSVTATVPVYATVSSTPTNVVSSSNPLLQIGTVYPALSMTVGNTPNNFTQCIYNAQSFTLTFQELTVTSAFRTLVDEGVGATGGTRLLATFTNIPSGVTIQVSNYNVSGSATAAYVTDADSSGNGGAFTTGAPAYVTANQSGGNWYAVWEITGENLATIDTATFNVQAVYTPNPGAGVPGLTSTTAPTTVTGSFAPVSTVLVASSTAPVPRFQNTNLQASPLFTIVPCITNLLFPYVTNLQGYDTGLAIANTSMDVFGTSPQTGNCTLNFFGNATVAAFPTPTVQPGTIYADVLESFGAAGFEGYIIAQCNFQFGHGLAFIVNPGGVGTQYLALVIPNLPQGNRPPGPVGINTGTGEQLGL